MRRRFGLLLTLTGLALMLGLVPAWAQSRLFDGASLLGRIAQDSPTAQYSFDASTGDRVGVRVLGLDALDPMLTVLGPDGAEVAASLDDAWGFAVTDSLVTFSAPQAGPYTVLVQGEADSSGDFLLQFDQSPAGTTALLPGGQTATIPVIASAGPLRLQFAANADCPTVLAVQSRSGEGFSALVNLLDEQGTVIGQVGAALTEERVTVAAGSGLYTAEIVPLPGSADGEMALTVACAAEQPACTEAPASVAEAVTEATPSGLLMVQSGGALGYSEARQGELGQASPLVGYTFEGSAGDEIALQVTGISLDFNPKLTLISPTLATLATAEDSPGAFRPNDALLRAVLPEDGRYSALVGSAGDQAGVFLIRLLESTAADVVTLVPDTPTDVEPNARYAFTALDSCPTALDVETADGAPLAAGVIVRAAGGNPAGQFYRSSIVGAHLVVPAASGDYEVLIPRSVDTDGSGAITLRVSCQLDSLACAAEGNPLLISTPTPGEPPFAATATLVTAAGHGPAAVVAVPSANVRRGDSTAFGVIRALASGTEVTLLGVSTSGSGWFKVLMPQGDEGWMSPQVLTISGDTSRLPGLIPPQPPPTSAAPAPATAVPGAVAACGNNVCDPGEESSCCGDCGTCEGGGGTEPDQPAGPVCGNSTCEAGESCSSCSGDCGSGGPNPCATYCVCPNVAREVQSCGVCLSQTCPNGTSTPRCYAPGG